MPACTGNSSEENGRLCTGAVATCPEPGHLRYWVYRRTVTPADPDPAWIRVYDPPWRCVGPDQAQAFDPRAAIAGVIESEFRRVVVQRGVAEVAPAPQTLVNIPTRFRTPTPERYDIPLTLLGQSVVITAQAESWTWHVGDGATPTTSTKGTGGQVEHVYRRAGDYAPYVVISWSGTYRLNGDPTSLPISGTVTTQGEPVDLGVRQARTQLEAG